MLKQSNTVKNPRKNLVYLVVAIDCIILMQHKKRRPPQDMRRPSFSGKIVLPPIYLTTCTRTVRIQMLCRSTRVLSNSLVWMRIFIVKSYLVTRFIRTCKLCCSARELSDSWMRVILFVVKPYLFTRCCFSRVMSR